MTELNEILQKEFVSGKRLLEQGRPDEAYCCFARALSIEPLHPDILIHAGVALAEAKQFAEAATLYRRFLAVMPEHGIAWNNLGNALLELGDFAEAATAYVSACRWLPSSPIPLAAQATALQMLGDVAEAEQCCRRAIALDPMFAEGHWNLALALLVQGKLVEGWQEFEWRWAKKDFSSPQRNFMEPLWDGSSLNGAPILIHAEQGFGDTIQFVRYLPMVLARGGKVIIECHPQLMPLLAGIKGGAAVCPFGATLPSFQCHIPMLSLPRLFGTTLETVPNEVPYLSPPEERRLLWANRLPATLGLRVGLAWAGSTHHRNDALRSVSFSQLEPLLKLSGVDFVSLQLGSSGTDLSRSQYAAKVIDLTGQINDFADTAALVDQLDLVVSVDTAVAHLAAAMGKPVWMLLPFAPDWRWLLNRNDSPWYPTMRLFRQTEHGQWGPVISRVVVALGEKISNSRVSVSERPIRIFSYRPGEHYLLTNANRYGTVVSTPLAKALSSGHPDFCSVNSPVDADFILFPEYLDALLDNVGIDGTRRFLASLPYFADYEHCHIFCSNHDNSDPLGLMSLFLQTSVNRYRRDPYAYAVPYPPEWVSDPGMNYDRQNIRFLTCFTGNIASSLIRSELVLSVLKEQRLSVHADPIPAFHCHLSFDEQVQRRANFLQSIRDSLTVLCPRGEGLNSIRFFETMALGRIPVLVADSCLLPYEDLIAYDDCMFRIPESDVNRAGVLLADWLEAMGADRLMVMCHRARMVWEEYFAPSRVMPMTVSILRQQLVARQAIMSPPMVDRNSDVHIDATMAKARELIEADRTAEALLLCDNVLRKYPDNAKLWHMRGCLSRMSGNFAEAVKFLECAVRLEPEHPDYGESLAVALTEVGRWRDAEAFLRALLHADPARSNCWINLGQILQHQGCLAEALESYRRAEAIAPHDPRPPYGAAVVLQALGRLDDAERYFVRTLILKPDSGDALWKQSRLLLLKGKYVEGFVNFEARFEKSNPIQRRHSGVPEWDGSSNNQALLVWVEQESNEIVQFARYLPLVKSCVGLLYVECMSEFQRDLMVTVEGVDRVFLRGGDLPHFDLEIPMMSLPRVFGTTLSTIPVAVPYIFAPADKVKFWREIIPHGVTTVGIVWRSNSEASQNQFSVLSSLLPVVTGAPHLRFVNLQADADAGEVAELELAGILNPLHGMQVFADTAALMMNLDLILAVDSPLAHLAGGLGMPVWLMLPFTPAWQWGVGSDSVAWYPNMKLIRQLQIGDWEQVMQDVLNELKGMRTKPS